MNVPASSPAWRHSAQVASVDDGERVVLLDVARAHKSQPQLLTGPSAAVWRAIDGIRSTHEIIAEVAPAFGSNQEDLGGDVRDFLQLLSLTGLAGEGHRSESEASPR